MLFPREDMKENMESFPYQSLGSTLHLHFLSV